jgi:hypothetical protein
MCGYSVGGYWGGAGGLAGLVACLVGWGWEEGVRRFWGRVESGWKVRGKKGGWDVLGDEWRVDGS